MALGPGSIAFVGFNADGNDNLAFVALTDLAAGTVITFTDNEWSGSAFNTGESTWTWTATSDIAAGTTVTLDNLAAGLTATSNLGTIAWLDETARNIDDAKEVVYAYVGSAAAPTFLTAIGNGSFLTANGLLTNTGLTQNQTAISLATLDADADIAVYNGPHATGESYANLLSVINNASNWVAQDTAANNSADGVNPDAPFPTTPFVIDPNAQKVAFAAESLSISHVEGDSGTTLYTFIVERTNGITGTVNFSGTFARGTTLAADYAGGTLPTTFSGTIPDGASSATVTIAVAGDNIYEGDESFSLTLSKVTSSDVTVYLNSGPLSLRQLALFSMTRRSRSSASPMLQSPSSLPKAMKVRGSFPSRSSGPAMAARSATRRSVAISTLSLPGRWPTRTISEVRRRLRPSAASFPTGRAQ